MLSNVNVNVNIELTGNKNLKEQNCIGKYYKTDIDG